MRKAISMQSEAITWSSESIRGKRRSQYLWGLGAVVSTCMRGKAKGARSQVHCGDEHAYVRRNRLVERGHVGLWVRVIMRTVESSCQIRVESSCRRRAAGAASAGSAASVAGVADGVRAFDKVLRADRRGRISSVEVASRAFDKVLRADEAPVDLMLMAAMRSVQLGERGQVLG